MESQLVLAVDDDAFTLSMLTGVIATTGFTVHGELTAAKAFQYVQKLSPATALIDLDLGDGPTGIDLAHALRRINPKIGIVLLTSYEDPRLHRPNLPELPQGARYLVKQNISSQELLVSAIKESIEKPLGLIKDEENRLIDFTDVQIETLRLVAQGLSNSEIAKIRFVTEKTVEQTITRLAKQLGITQTPNVNSRVQLARTYFSKTGKSLDSD
jgi:DNA-binding NarL/FixJ family response regulator